jgi:hypothetical protein
VAIPIVAYGSVISMCISLMIVVLLIKRKGVDQRTVSFAVCVFFMAVWVLTETFYHFVEPESLSRLMIQIGYASVSLMSTALLIFVMSFWKKRKDILALIILVGIAIALLPFLYSEGQTFEQVGDYYMSFAGPVYIFTGIPYSAFAYMLAPIFLIWISKDIQGESKRRARITSMAHLFQYPISTLSYLYSQFTVNPLFCSVAQSLTLPFTLGAILYALAY